MLLFLSFIFFLFFFFHDFAYLCSAETWKRSRTNKQRIYYQQLFRLHRTHNPQNPKTLNSRDPTLKAAVMNLKDSKLSNAESWEHSKLVKKTCSFVFVLWEYFSSHPYITYLLWSRCFCDLFWFLYFVYQMQTSVLIYCVNRFLAWKPSSCAEFFVSFFGYRI